MAEKQTDGRDKNGAMPVDAATPSTSSKDADKVGAKERRSAGPDGPDATEVGDTFKKQP